MISLGLTNAELSRLKKLLVSNHRIAVDIQLLTLSHKYEGLITKHLLGGQVNFDAEATEATRSCNLQLLDPTHALQLDSSAPADGSLYGTKMIKVIYHVIPIDGKPRFSIPIFTGPLTKVSRNGPILDIEAMGKEILSLDLVWKGRTFRAGMKKTEVIALILTEMGGEAKGKLDFANKAAKNPNKISVDRKDTPWAKAQSIAQSMGMQLFYDGRGVARLRQLPNKTVHVFEEKKHLLSNPSATYDMNDAINCVEVVGGVPKGQKKKITARVVADRNHSLSPWTLGRNGNPRYLPLVIEDDSIRNKTEAKKVAKNNLQRSLIQAVDVSFDSLPIPFLEERDLCRVQSDKFSGSFYLRQMVIPLTADGVSAIGYLKRVTPKNKVAKGASKKKKKGKNRDKGKKK